ncbi:MAG: NIPSNAP family protein [Nitrososphaerales archaeon]
MVQNTPAHIEGSSPSRILELRQYTLRPGKRDILIDLWERYFVEEQENMGADLVGQFRQENNQDKFVWLRGFPDMATRGRMLAAFYSCPIWIEHRQEANATMVDSDNVLLLREAWPGAGFHHEPRKSFDFELPIAGLVTANILYLDSGPTNAVLGSLESVLAQILLGAGASDVATYVTEHSPNNYPRLPIRERENVFMWFSRFEGGEAFEEHVRNLAGNVAWSEIQQRLARYGGRPAETLILDPTRRSKYR